MSQAPTPLDTAQGFSPPTVVQFSVFLVNKVGKLLDLVENFDEASCSICAVSVHESSDHAVVRVITNNASEARKLLREDGLPFGEHEVLVVSLCKGHTLSRLCLHLLGAEINIAFAYPLMIKPNGDPTIAIAVDDHTLAGQILRRKGFNLLGEADLPKMD
ncbi:MAG: acetolactate synthase [Planctomycetota bacterium]